MTSAPIMRRRAMLATLASPLWLAACGKGGGSGTAYVRGINLTLDLPSLDLYLTGTKEFSALATGVISSSFSAIDAEAYTLNINSAGNATTLFTGSYSFTKNDHYTAVVWGAQSALQVTTLPEDDDTTLIGTGNTRVRMFNATSQTGTLDVYLIPATQLTTSNFDLSASLPVQGDLTSGSLSGFHEIAAGTYSLYVTGYGVPTDLRLYVAAVTLSQAQYSSLVLTAGSGGVLVNGTLIVEQGAATLLSSGGGATGNAQARVRIISSVDNSGLVSATIGGIAVATQLPSPTAGDYVLVSSGTPSLSISVNGNPVLTGSITLAAGGDYSLLVYGSAGNIATTTIVDDNTLPVSTTRTKMRLVNGVAGLDPLTLVVDYAPVPGSTNVTAGAASTYAQIPSDNAAYIQVDSPSQGALYTTTRTNGDVLVGQGVYTMFVLSGKSTPTAFIRNERFS
jgi:hypothetical protein